MDEERRTSGVSRGVHRKPRATASRSSTRASSTEPATRSTPRCIPGPLVRKADHEADQEWIHCVRKNQNVDIGLACGGSWAGRRSARGCGPFPTALPRCSSRRSPTRAPEATMPPGSRRRPRRRCMRCTITRSTSSERQRELAGTSHAALGGSPHSARSPHPPTGLMPRRPHRPHRRDRLRRDGVGRRLGRAARPTLRLRRGRIERRYAVERRLLSSRRHPRGRRCGGRSRRTVAVGLVLGPRGRGVLRRGPRGAAGPGRHRSDSRPPRRRGCSTGAWAASRPRPNPAWTSCRPRPQVFRSAKARTGNSEVSEPTARDSDRACPPATETL